MGLVMLLMLSGMSRIPAEQFEAARLDGAGAVREFFAITLPAVRGEITVALVLTIIAALKTFDLVYMTTSGGPGNSTTVPSYERSEEHTSELQSRGHLVCRLLLEKKKTYSSTSSKTATHTDEVDI